MSRHEFRIDDRTELAAGYDTAPRPSYFFQKFVDDEPVFSISTDPMCTITPHPDYPRDKRWDQHEIAALIRKEGGPEEWARAMGDDLPF